MNTSPWFFRRGVGCGPVTRGWVAHARNHFGSVVALLLAPLASAQILVTRTFMPNLVIPDFGEVVSAPTIAVGGGTIQNLQVDLQLMAVAGSGPMFNGDYYATLGHGAGFAVLLNRPGRTASNGVGYSDNGFNVTFADNAATGDIHAYRTAVGGPPPGGMLAGLWAPDGRNVDPATVNGTEPRTATLSSFNGLSPDGEWRLFISDEGAGGVARLASWTLRMQIMPDASTLLRLSDFDLAGAAAPQTLTNPFEFTGTSKVSGNYDLTLQGALTGTGTLTKEGTGKLVIHNPAGFAGALAVTAGTVELPAGLTGSGGGVTVGATGRLSALGAVTRNLVNQGVIVGPAIGSGQFLVFNGTVSGAGAYEGRIAMNGTFSPGNSPGIVNVTGDLLLDSANLLTMELGGTTAGSEYDRINVTGLLTFGGTMTVSLINGFSPISGQSFQLFNAGSWSGTFSTLQLPGLSGGLAWNTNQLTSSGLLSVTSAIPEPATVALGFGLVALGVAAWRRRRGHL